MRMGQHYPNAGASTRFRAEAGVVGVGMVAPARGVAVSATNTARVKRVLIEILQGSSSFRGRRHRGGGQGGRRRRVVDAARAEGDSARTGVGEHGSVWVWCRGR
ncbi:hypothetical protein MOPEL_135_00280 [Mobilicoccus pelagius NBRC 104925]|uniref:Uncharacterized protein n=1 Tax=Mobilicoccus pelagius NBRC 104925 TaxID=1089455 RepID=H5UVN2_9MICO|nr:hypothetical protein MOPEL_135_00280 [Mobilicoccus pelagius NBRC 104925]